MHQGNPPKARYHDVRCCLSTCSLAGGGPRPLSLPLSCLSYATLYQRWHFIGVPVWVWRQGPGRSKETEDRAFPEASRATQQATATLALPSPLLVAAARTHIDLKRPLGGHYPGWVKCLCLSQALERRRQVPDRTRLRAWARDHDPGLPCCPRV